MHTPGITGLALLTFLAHGETTASEEFGNTVEKAIRYLIKAQDESGAFFDRKTMLESEKAADKSKIKSDNLTDCPYVHGMATYAVSEAYGLMRIPELKPVMEKAIQIIIDGQQSGGGWDYKYRKSQRRDTSISGWQIQALKAANIAGAGNDGLKKAMMTALDDLKAYQNSNGIFWYYNREDAVSRSLSQFRLQTNTGIAVLCLQLLGQGLSEAAKDGLNALKMARCAWQNSSEQYGWYLYGWYYITQAKFHAGGTEWATWNNKFAEVLTSHQLPDGHWEAPLVGPEACADGKHGPVYSTSLAALTLQVYYRFLPTYKADAVKVDEMTAESSQDDVVIEF